MSTEDKSIDYASMSDEEIMAMDTPLFDEEHEVEVDEDFEEDLENEEDTLEEDDIEDEDTDVESDEDDSEEEEDDDSDDEEEDDFEEDKDVEEDEEDDEEESDEEVSTDEYKAKYEALMAPLKANKKEITIDSPEELRRLAQMGLGFNDKMAAIKPIRKIGKMLEDAGLLDESKVNFLIDLSKNDSNAITKLIKDSGIDPLDLDVDSSVEYTPNKHNVNDNRIDLSDTLEQLQETESGQTVISEVDTVWDEDSKMVLLNDPTMLLKLEEQVKSGFYDKVMTVLNKERALGNVPKGVNDLQAYSHIGSHLMAQEQQAPVEQKKPKVIKKKSNTKRNKLRQAASASRSNGTKTKVDTSDILNMSDEDFAKLSM